MTNRHRHMCKQTQNFKQTDSETKILKQLKKLNDIGISIQEDAFKQAHILRSK